MPNRVKSLAEVLPQELREGESQPLDDYLDKPLIFHNCREVQGKQGAYFRIVVSEPGNDNQFYLATGASQVMEVLKYCKDNRLFPIQAKLTRKGRAILLLSA